MNTSKPLTTKKALTATSEDSHSLRKASCGWRDRTCAWTSITVDANRNRSRSKLLCLNGSRKSVRLGRRRARLVQAREQQPPEEEYCDSGIGLAHAYFQVALHQHQKRNHRGQREQGFRSQHLAAPSPEQRRSVGDQRQQGQQREDPKGIRKIDIKIVRAAALLAGQRF